MGFPADMGVSGLGSRDRDAADLDLDRSRTFASGNIRVSPGVRGTSPSANIVYRTTMLSGHSVYAFSMTVRAPAVGPPS